MFGPRNSLVLQFDHFTDELTDEMEQQLDEIGKYYRFVPFSQMLRAGKRARKMGVASVVIQNARKSFFLRAMNRLRDRDIVPLICVRPDIQGTNRLPLLDEWRAYQIDFPSEAELSALSWERPDEAEAKLKSEWKNRGPIPLDTMDPTLFLGTWGNLIEIPPPLYEVGVHIPHRRVDSVFLSKEREFVRKQLAKEAQIAFLPQADTTVSSTLQAAGFVGAVSVRAGIVDRSTSAYDIPRFFPERT